MCYSFSKQIPREPGDPGPYVEQGEDWDWEGKNLHLFTQVVDNDESRDGVPDKGRGGGVAAESDGRRPYAALWFQNLQHIGSFILR